MTTLQKIAMALAEQEIMSRAPATTTEQMRVHVALRWRGFVAVARVAVATLRDPGHDITAAVVCPGEDRTQAVADFNAMIDAILKEGEAA